jgi:hypothetical protein
MPGRSQRPCTIAQPSVPIGCEGLFIVHFAIGQSCRIIQLWTGSTRARAEQEAVAGSATSVSAIFASTPTATRGSSAWAETGATTDARVGLVR